MSIKKKILISMIILIVICAESVLFSTVCIFNNYVDEVMDDRINAASAVGEEEFNIRKAYSYTAAMQIAENREIIQAISDNDRNALLTAATELQKQSGVEFCTILDTNGIVLVRSHEPNNYGDSLASQVNIQSAMSGKSTTAVEQGSAVRLSIRSGAPIYDSMGTLIGVASVGFRMDTDSASEEQSNGIKQVNIAVTQMEKVTQQNAAMAEETTASAQNLHKEAAVLEQVVVTASKLIKNR